MERHRLSNQLLGALTLAGVCVLTLLLGVTALFDGADDEQAQPLLATALALPGDALSDRAFFASIDDELGAVNGQGARQSLASWRGLVGDGPVRAELAGVARSVCFDANSGTPFEQIRKNLSPAELTDPLGGQGPIVALAASIVMCPAIVEDAVTR